MYAALNGIEGMISGPAVFWHYTLTLSRGQTRLTVLAQQCSPRDDDRIERRFWQEIMARMAQEQAGAQHFPTRTPGQFYLRRSRPGMDVAHPHCRAAVSTRALDQMFVSQLQGWELSLLHP